jgi:hypothetical protein
MLGELTWDPISAIDGMRYELPPFCQAQPFESNEKNFQ